MNDHPLGACPFCGSTAAGIEETPPKPNDKVNFVRPNTFRVRCAMCDASTGGWGMVEKAIEAWHRRPADWQLRARIESLRRTDRHGYDDDEVVNQTLNDVIAALGIK